MDASGYKTRYAPPNERHAGGLPDWLGLYFIFFLLEHPAKVATVAAGLPALGLASVLGLTWLQTAYTAGVLVVSVVVVETVFAYPGLGQLFVDSVSKRDIPVVQVVAMVFASTYIVLNLVADMVALAANPRLMHPR